ncbi:hypothetical protein ACS0TY_029455 [Phlomoides rotata]
MACLEMYNQNSEHKALGGAPPMSPRISFSNDFVDSSSSSSSRHHHQIRTNAAYRDAPVSSDFEFSITNYSTITADELFSKGRLLPLKETSTSSRTLREELQEEEEEAEQVQENFSLRPPKNPTRWRRGFLGLRKSHIGSKKSEKSVDKRTEYNHDDVQCSKNSSQDYVD